MPDLTGAAPTMRALRWRRQPTLPRHCGAATISGPPRFTWPLHSPALITDLNSLQAKAYARIGDQGGCHAAMTRAEAAVTRIRPDQEPPETSYVQAGLVETQHADALANIRSRIDCVSTDPAQRRRWRYYLL
jgi:hypothetical protein